MMKLLGALLVLLAGTLIGFQQAARFSERPRQLRVLAHALQRLETEIGYGHTPLPEALDRIAGTLQEPFASLFRAVAAGTEGAEGLSLSECWEAAATTYWRDTSLKGNERAIWLRLGSTLGISDKEDQMKHIRHAVLQLRTEEEAAADDQKRYENMWRSLGVLLAALIVILMV